MEHGLNLIKDLGTLDGEVLVFGGPYSNLEATQALLQQAERREIPAHQVICTGDAVAYCAQPRETLAALNGACVHVAGNCEKQLAQNASDCGCGFEQGTACNLAADQWYPYCASLMSDDDLKYMGQLPDMVAFIHNGMRYCVIHGGVEYTSRFIWPSSPDAVFQEEIAMIESKIGKFDAVLAGHCGVAFQRHIDGIHWINAGVIGMPPDDGRPDTRFVVLGPQGARIERLEYQAAKAACKMHSAGLPQGYARALVSGYWPSQDVLPPEMRR